MIKKEKQVKIRITKDKIYIYIIIIIYIFIEIINCNIINIFDFFKIKIIPTFIILFYNLLAFFTRII